MAAFEILVGLLAGSALLVAYAVYRYCYAPFQFLKRYGIKGPPPTPFLGNYKGRVKMPATEYDKIMSEKYGPVWGYYIGGQAYILISDLEMLKQILVKDFDSFTDHVPFPNFFTDDPVMSDLFSSHGDRWKEMRRMLSPSFSASKMKMMVPLIKKCTDNLVSVIEAKADSQESFDVIQVYTSFALEAILATAFGRRVDLQKGESDEVTKAMSMITQSVSDGQFEQFLVMSYTFPWTLKVMKFFFTRSAAGNAMQIIKQITLDLIKSRREGKQTDKYKDILQLMIEASDEGDEEGEGEGTGEPPAECPVAHQPSSTKKGTMTDKEVYWNCVGFLGAGNDTTSITLSFMSYLLALHPDIQEKLQSEIDEYFEDKPDSNLYTAAQEITYLDQVLQECLRFYPPAPETDRLCTKATEVNGLTIPKGAIITVPIGLLHHSPLYWEDPETFNPDRFTAEEKAKRPQMCYMPFGFGPRICIGMRLAQLQIKIVLIELLQKFTFVKAPETEVPLKLGVGLAIRPSQGIHLKVVKRS